MARVDMRVYIPGVWTVKPSERKDGDRLRRCARVTLRWPIVLPTGETVGPVFFAPLYRGIFKNERESTNEDGFYLVWGVKK